MEYKICNSTDKKHISKIIIADDIPAIVNKVSELFESDFEIQKLVKNKLIVRDSHNTVVLKKLN